MDDYSEIIPNLYIGNESSVTQFRADTLHLLVNCSKDIPFQLVCDMLIRLPVDDNPAEYERLYYFLDSMDVLHKIHQCILLKKSVLVYCKMGIQMSVAVVACYLIRYCRLNPGQSVYFIKKKRTCAFLDGIHFAKTMDMIYTNTLPNVTHSLCR